MVHSALGTQAGHVSYQSPLSPGTPRHLLAGVELEFMGTLEVS